MDAAILFSDILMVPYGLGQKTDFTEAEGPVLKAVCNQHDLDNLSFDRFHDTVAPVYETIKMIKDQLDDDTALIGFSGAPWTVACYMVQGSGSKEWERVRTASYSETAFFERLIGELVWITAEYLSAQVKAGAEALQIFDSWAGLLSPSGFRRWVIEPTRQLVKRVKEEHNDIPIIGFPRGNSNMIEEYIVKTGVDAISLDTTVPPEWAEKTIKPLIPIQGNLDPFLLVSGGRALSVETDVLLEFFGKRPYIFNLGHGVSQTTDPKNVLELSKYLKTWPERRQ